MRYASTFFACAVISAGCSLIHQQYPTSAEAYPGYSPQPPPPIIDADPSRRHGASILVPTALRAVPESENLASTTNLVQWHYVFTGWQYARVTVGYKMLAGGSVEIAIRRNGKEAWTAITGNYGEPRLPSKVPTPTQEGLHGNEIPSECRVTVFETDQPAGYHVDAEQGNYYRILWTRTFDVAH